MSARYYSIEAPDPVGGRTPSIIAIARFLFRFGSRPFGPLTRIVTAADMPEAIPVRDARSNVVVEIDTSGATQRIWPQLHARLVRQSESISRSLDLNFV